MSKARSRRKTEQMYKFLGPHFFWGATPILLQQIVRAINLFGKVWLSSVCSPLSAKPGNDVESRIYGGWVKMHVEFEAVCGPKFMTFWDGVETLIVVNTLDRLSISYNTHLT